MPPRCLYTLLLADPRHHETLLREFAAPVADALRDDARLDSLFFARYNKPDWQLRFRVLGEEAWVDGPVRDLIERSLAPLAERGLFSTREFATYEREYARYGGEEGMRLAERIFLHDTLACLDLIRVDEAGSLAKSRREYSLVYTERFLDLMGFDRRQRLAFYHMGYRWAQETGSWQDEELDVLGRRYETLKDGLRRLFDRERPLDAETLWGGAEPARIALTCLEAQRPVVEELLRALAAGRVAQDPVHLAWSYAHMHCNRLGIVGHGEAVIRYFLHRLHEDGAGGAA